LAFYESIVVSLLQNSRGVVVIATELTRVVDQCEEDESSIRVVVVCVGPRRQEIVVVGSRLDPGLLVDDAYDGVLGILVVFVVSVLEGVIDHGKLGNRRILLEALLHTAG
jgi:hypothetical protein